MRTSGMMEYMTPRQMATESSRTPKSVMKTIVGRYFCAVSLAAAAPVGMCDSKTNKSTSARRTVRCDERIGMLLDETVIERPCRCYFKSWAYGMPTRIPGCRRQCPLANFDAIGEETVSGALAVSRFEGSASIMLLQSKLWRSYVASYPREVPRSFSEARLRKPGDSY